MSEVIVHEQTPEERDERIIRFTMKVPLYALVDVALPDLDRMIADTFAVPLHPDADDGA